MGVFIFASLSWVLSARKWFIGPISNLDDKNGDNVMEEKGSDQKLD
jgi:hypothetical protein